MKSFAVHYSESGICNWLRILLQKLISLAGSEHLHKFLLSPQKVSCGSDNICVQMPLVVGWSIIVLPADLQKVGCWPAKRIFSSYSCPYLIFVIFLTPALISSSKFDTKNRVKRDTANFATKQCKFDYLFGVVWGGLEWCGVTGVVWCGVNKTILL